MTTMNERCILHAHFHLPDGAHPELYEQLLLLAEGITPRVQAIPPDSAHLDISGALRYWQRDPEGLAVLLRLRTMALHGVQTTCAIALNRTQWVRRFPEGSTIEPVARCGFRSLEGGRFGGAAAVGRSARGGGAHEAASVLPHGFSVLTGAAGCLS
ncbi:hypothetical protein OG239_01180 [Streptomyces sp. NBC_00868]|uniref:hypothetical protein n=1 Tax=Streptomyces sp. NBC_00868 TaxID=2903683 RepID=UPI00386D8EA6|nr:hypothetical protein OG239_01180 [Streptomyces sp. NBC_00868]